MGRAASVTVGVGNGGRTMSQFHPTGWDWDAIGMTVGAIFLVLAVFGWLVWNRWLSHKETMKLTEAGGDSRAALQLRERWRTRWGILWAVRVLALGLAAAAALHFAESWEPRFGLGRRMIGPELALLLAAAAAFLLTIGAVTLVAYAIWSRRDVGVLALGLLGEEKKVVPDAGEEGEEQSEAGREAEGERSE